MSDIALRPRSSTELVDAAFQLYRREPLQFIAGLALVYVPWLVVLSLTGLTATLQGQVAPTIVAGLVAMVGGILTYVYSLGVTTVIANDLYFGRQANVGKAFMSVTRRFFPLLGALLLVFFLIFILVIPLAIVGALISVVGGAGGAAAAGVTAIVMGIGMLVLMFYIFARFFAVKQVVLLENKSSVEAVKRSASLSADQKWHILVTFLLVMLVNIAVIAGVMLVATMIPSPIVQLVLQTIGTVIVYPLLGIVETLLYYDARIRREGFDIEYLAAAAPGPLPAESPAT